jgi:CRISPR-associated protein (TIGR02584 family)
MLEMNDKKIVLVVGMGTSPAVMTETVWALAHQAERVVPDEIVVITTKSGKDALLAAIMSGAPCVWNRLKNALAKEDIAIDGKLVFGDTSIRVIPDADGNEASDLRTGADNLRAADFMLGELRKYTADSVTTVLCSIAGGRKTMSALLFSCMSLLGREEDKVYHVLIPPEYDCGMNPPFFFPEKAVKHELLSRGQPTGKRVSSTKIGIELFEVPFVRMRGWYQDKFKSELPSYKSLISKVQSVAPPAVVYPEIEIDALNGCITMCGKVHSFSPQLFALLVMLANRISKLDTVYKKFCKLTKIGYEGECIWLEKLQVDPYEQNPSVKFANYDDSNWREQNQEVSKIVNRLRTKIKKIDEDVAKALVPESPHPVIFPQSQIKWVNRDKLADICGYLFADIEE